MEHLLLILMGLVLLVSTGLVILQGAEDESLEVDSLETSPPS